MQQNLCVKKIKWKNLVCAICSGTGSAVILLSMSNFQNAAPETLKEKIALITGFTLLSAALVFLTLFFLNAIRNLFAGAVLRLTENGLKLPKRDIIPYSEVKQAVVTDNNTLQILLKNGETISLRQKKMNMPAYTVAHAINNRLK